MKFQQDKNWIYALDDDGNIIAEVTFPNIEDGVVNINHTYVDNSLRGQGVAGKLVEAACDCIEREDKKAVLTCPYAIKWFDEHPEKKNLVK